MSSESSSKANATLQELDLNNNRIDDEGIQHMAAALPTMTGLRKLYVLNNEISSAQINGLVEGLQRNSILRELHLTESLEGYEDIQYRLALNKGGRQLLTTKKHVPLALWPLVLERAATTTTTKQHANNKHNYSSSLDVLYHLVQGPVLLHRDSNNDE
jgi:hypothetical protein